MTLSYIYERNKCAYYACLCSLKGDTKYISCLPPRELVSCISVSPLPISFSFPLNILDCRKTVVKLYYSRLTRTNMSYIYIQ